MKKSIIFVTIVLLIFGLVACDPADYFYPYDELKENVKTIELINYNNTEAKKLFEKRDGVLPFDFEKMEVVEVLAAEKTDDFLQALSQIQFHMTWVHSDSPHGMCIRIMYENDDFEIISAYVDYGYVGSFDAGGNVKRFIGNCPTRQNITDIINKYFETQI